LRRAEQAARFEGTLEEPSMVAVLVDGKRIEAADGATVLQALQLAGVHVPTLCHDDRIAPLGACRTCLVHVKGWPKPVPACMTRLTDGMEIEADTAALNETRKGILEMLARRYPRRAFDRFPDEPFHRELRRAGLTDRLASDVTPDRPDRSHPYIAVDMARCIDCYRCVRICAEVQGRSVWHVRGRGMATAVEPDGPTLRDSSCVSCGACVDTCPTGALSDAASATSAPPSHWTRTTCPYCGVGCELSVGTRGDRIVAVEPVLTSPVSKGHLCVKGRYAFGFVADPDRITEPMIRGDDSWRRVSWTEARAFVAGRLAQLIERNGPDSIGLLGSARATNEDNFVAQKLARTVIGTHNVDCCARVCHAPSAAALKRAFGAGLATNSFDDIERARTILVCGANASESHPVVGARILQAARRGARLVVIDPRRTELARHADWHVAPRPGTDVALLNALAHVIVAEGLVDREFLERRVAARQEFEEAIAAWPPERAAAICGVDAETIRQVGRLYGAHAPAMSVHGLGVTEHVHGTDTVTALINLALLTGNVGKPGAGVNPLRGQNNVQGAAHMGCDPAVLPGSLPLEQGRPIWEALWGRPLPVVPGLHMLQMLDAALAGRFKALWTIGYDVLLTNPNADETRRALRSLDLVIVQDMFLTETARACATVFLPACSSFEKDGTFMNAERRIQRVRAALPPAGASKPDWQILSEIARVMGGHGFGYASPEDIWTEVRAGCEGARGMTYTRLDAGGLQWPCPDERHPGTAILHQDSFPIGARVNLRPVDFRESAEVVTAEFPFTLMTGRSLYQFNAGTMTGRTANNILRPSDVLDMAPADAHRLGYRDGQLVTVTSRYGEAVLPMHVDDGVSPGQLFATFQSPGIRLNALTGPYRDECVATPEFKVTAVRIAAAG
jgi:formate dehydrogenase major subunit